MAVISASLLTFYSADELLKLRRMPLLYNLTTRQHVGQFEAGTAADEIVIDITDPTSSDRARDGDWATAADGTTTVQTVDRTGGKSISTQLAKKDVTESPVNLVEAYRVSSRKIVALDADDHAWTQLLAGAGTTIAKFGTNANRINRTSPFLPQTDAARDLMIDLLDTLSIQLGMSDLQGGDVGLGAAWLILPIPLFSAAQAALVKLGTGWDRVSETVLSGNSLLASQPFRGRYKNIDVFGSNLSPTPDAGSDWVWLAGVREAACFGISRPDIQFFTPEDNQVSTKPAYLWRYNSDFAVKVLYSDGIIKGSFDSES